MRRRGKEIREENAIAFYIDNLLHSGLTKLQHIMSYLIETNTDDGIVEIGNSGSRKKRKFTAALIKFAARA